MVGSIYLQKVQGLIFLKYQVLVGSIYFQPVQGFICLNSPVLDGSIYFQPVTDNLMLMKCNELDHSNVK